MPDPLSVASGSFAVVGVIDVVLRASVACYQFLGDIKDAPKEINSLTASIKENQRLVSIFKGYLNDVRNALPSYPPQNADEIPGLDQCQSSVKSLQRELNSLSLSMKKYSSPERRWGKVKWVLDERKIGKSLEKLEKSKSMMTMGLLLMEGHRTAAGLKETQLSVRRLSSAIDARSEEVALLNGRQRNIAATSTETMRLSKQTLKQGRQIQTYLRQTNQTRREEHSKIQKSIQDGTRTTISTISSRIQDLSHAVERSPTANKKHFRAIYFAGHSRESILTPLLLMKEQLHSLILRTVSTAEGRVPSEILYWLESEFESLVASAIQETAALTRGSTATPIDEWIYVARDGYLHHRIQQEESYMVQNVHEDQERRGLSRTSIHNRPCRDRRTVYQTLTFHSPAGKLIMITPTGLGDVNPAGKIQEGQLFFFPTAGICSTSIRATFFTSAQSQTWPKLYAQLHAFRLIKITNDLIKKYAELFKNSTLEQVDSAFRNGVIAPYDQAEYFCGLSLALVFVAICGRLDVLQYMESQGFGPSALKGEVDTLAGLWVAIRAYNDIGMQPKPRILQILSYFDDKLPLDVFVSPNAYALLCPNVSSDDDEYKDEAEQLKRTWIEFLKRHEYNFEIRNPRGYTPLLSHSYAPWENSSTMVDLLLEFGADANAEDLQGCNAIHLVMYSYIEPLDSGTYASSETVEGKLVLLIRNGVDLNHRNKYGYTPSHLACYVGCWAEWCGALKRTEQDLTHILSMNDEVSLLAGFCEHCELKLKGGESELSTLDEVVLERREWEKYRVGNEEGNWDALE